VMSSGLIVGLQKRLACWMSESAPQSLTTSPSWRGRGAPPAAGGRRLDKGHFRARHFAPMIDWRSMFARKVLEIDKLKLRQTHGTHVVVATKDALGKVL